MLLFGDSYGIPDLLGSVPVKAVAAIVGASIRPAYIEGLREIARNANKPFLVQPRYAETSAYDAFVRELARWQPDGLICHSYSMLVRPDVLQLVHEAAFNVHAALLPKNRGPNPIQWALIRGESQTGATLHVMDAQFDCGAIVDQEELEIHERDTWVSIRDRLKPLVRDLLKRTVPSLLDGTWRSRPQDESAATTNLRLPVESLPMKFDAMTDREIFNLVRAQVAPLAGAYVDSGAERRRYARYLSLAEIGELRRSNILQPGLGGDCDSG